MASRKKTTRKSSSRSGSRSRSSAPAARSAAPARDTHEPAADAEGLDYTKNPPAGHVVLGDGSEQNPNRVEPVSNWHGAPTA